MYTYCNMRVTAIMHLLLTAYQTRMHVVRVLTIRIAWISLLKMSALYKIY